MSFKDGDIPRLSKAGWLRLKKMSPFQNAADGAVGNFRFLHAHSTDTGSFENSAAASSGNVTSSPVRTFVHCDGAPGGSSILASLHIPSRMRYT
jgi:hypothetical protein